MDLLEPKPEQRPFHAAKYYIYRARLTCNGPALLAKKDLEFLDRIEVKTRQYLDRINGAIEGELSRYSDSRFHELFVVCYLRERSTISGWHTV